MVLSRLLLLVCAAGLLAACTPPSAPLYLDFERAADIAADSTVWVEALEAAGWAVEPGSTVVTSTLVTERRTLSRGFYSYSAEIELLPFRDGYLRALVHPYRASAIGSPVKLRALSAQLRAQLVDELAPAFEARGYELLEPAHRRDRRRTGT